MIHISWQNFARERWQRKMVKILRGFVFVLLWNLVLCAKVASLESMLT